MTASVDDCDRRLRDAHIFERGIHLENCCNSFGKKLFTVFYCKLSKIHVDANNYYEEKISHEEKVTHVMDKHLSRDRDVLMLLVVLTPPGHLTSGLQGALNVHRGDLLLVLQ